MTEDTLQTVGLSALKLLAKRLNTRLIFGIVPFAFGTATIILGVIGWSLKLYDGSLHSVGEIAFRASGDFAPSIKSLEGGNKITVLAALTGLLTLYSSLIAVLARLFREKRRKLLARHVHRGHPVVIGSTRLAVRAVDLWRRHDRRALQVVPNEETLLFGRPVVRHALEGSLVTGLALWRAGRIFIDAGDDARTLCLALELFAALAARGPGSTAPRRGDWIIILVRSDYAEHLAARLAELRRASPDPDGLPNVHVLRPERLIARQLMLASPPFLQAAPGRRLHALLVGFDPLGEEMLEAFCQLAMVVDRSPAMVTVLVASAAAARSRFFGARPALEGTVDVAFADALDDFQAGSTAAGIALRERDGAAPVTVVYLTAAGIGGALPAVMLLRAIRRRTGRLIAPSFVRTGNEGEVVSWRALFGSSPPDDFVEFGLSDAFLDAQLSAPATRDRLARALHEHSRIEDGSAGRTSTGTGCRRACVSPTATPPTTVLPRCIRSVSMSVAYRRACCRNWTPPTRRPLSRRLRTGRSCDRSCAWSTSGGHASDASAVGCRARRVTTARSVIRCSCPGTSCSRALPRRWTRIMPRSWG